MAGGPLGAPAPMPVAPAPQAQPIPQIDDDDSEDEDIRTVMRSPEQMIHEEESHDAPRTVLLADDEPWKNAKPLPAAGNPAPMPGRADPAPAPTMALPVHYEPAAPDFAHAASSSQAGGMPAIPQPDPIFQGAQGTQKIPPGVLLASGINVGPAFPGAAQPPLNQSIGNFTPANQQVLTGLTPQRVLGAAPPPDQQLAPDSRLTRASKKGLVLAALIALLIAAAATFAFLKIKGL